MRASSAASTFSASRGAGSSIAGNATVTMAHSKTKDLAAVTATLSR
ncbi:hypothetical protein [Neorhizobium galegae]